MNRWIFLGVAVLGLVISFVTHSAGVLALGFVLLFVGAFGCLISFASERIADRTRPDTAMLSSEELVLLHKPRKPDTRLPTTDSGPSRTPQDGRS